MELSAFEAAGALLPGMVPDAFGTLRQYSHKYGIKVWFDAERPTKEHYEAQVVGAKLVPDAKVLAIEIGFHSEHSKEADNEAVVDGLRAKERTWRKGVGKEPEIAVFLGRAEHWRRVSETWPDPDLGDPDLAFEIAARLTDYITAIEPARR